MTPGTHFQLPNKLAPNLNFKVHPLHAPSNAYGLGATTATGTAGPGTNYLPYTESYVGINFNQIPSHMKAGWLHYTKKRNKNFTLPNLE
jgi:hypothetical protein